VISEGDVDAFAAALPGIVAGARAEDRGGA
jgi:hypothetical protein